jgi:hypothetical protein
MHSAGHLCDSLAWMRRPRRSLVFESPARWVDGLKLGARRCARHLRGPGEPSSASPGPRAPNRAADLRARRRNARLAAGTWLCRKRCARCCVRPVVRPADAARASHGLTDRSQWCGGWPANCWRGASGPHAPTRSNVPRWPTRQSALQPFCNRFGPRCNRFATARPPNSRELGRIRPDEGSQLRAVSPMFASLRTT